MVHVTKMAAVAVRIGLENSWRPRMMDVIMITAIMAYTITITRLDSAATIHHSKAMSLRPRLGAAAQRSGFDLVLAQQFRDDLLGGPDGFRQGLVGLRLLVELQGQLGSRHALDDVVVDLQGAALAAAQVFKD